MKHSFRIIIGMLLFAIPLCLNAQVNPKKNNDKKPKEKVEQGESFRQGKAKATPLEETEKGSTDQMQPNKPEKPIMPDGKGPKGGNDWMPKISGFVQGLYQADVNGDGELSNTFRLRRVRLSVDGTLFKGLTYKIQGDFSRSPMLVDAYLKYKVCNEFAIQVGQFKTPFSLESPINPVNLEIFDYGEGIQKLVGYSDVCGVGGLGRDIGVMATGSLFPVKDEKGNVKYNVVDYAVGVFNGNGPTAIDNNNRKDIVGRLEVHPGLKDLTLSGSYYYGKYTKDDNVNCTRNRWAAGAQYNDGKIVLRGEYIGGTTGVAHTVIPEDLGYFNSNGYYAVAGYNFLFGKEGRPMQKLMPVLRYEHFTTDNAVANGGTNWYTAGINYWPLPSVNFKLDYSLVQKESGSNSHRVVGILSYKF